MPTIDVYLRDRVARTRDSRHWITVRGKKDEDDEEGGGSRVLIDVPKGGGHATVVGGAGGKLTGQTFAVPKSMSKAIPNGAKGAGPDEPEAPKAPAGSPQRSPETGKGQPAPQATETDPNKPIEWTGESLRPAGEVYAILEKWRGRAEKEDFAVTQVRNLEAKLTKAGYDPHQIPEPTAPPAADASGFKAWQSLPKTATGEVNFDEIAQMTGTSASSAKLTALVPGGWTTLYLREFDAKQALRKQAAQAAYDAKHKAEQAAYAAAHNTVPPEVTKATKAISDLGVTIAPIGNVSKGWKLKEPGTTVPIGPLHHLAAAGVARALQKMPEYGKKLSFVFCEKPDNNVAMTAGNRTGDGKFHMSLNTSNSLFNPTKANAWIDKVLAGEKVESNTVENFSNLPPGTTKEELISDMYRAYTFHELGHVKDAEQDWGISKGITKVLKKNLKTNSAIKDWVKKNVSSYAADIYDPKRGWIEVTAELHAMRCLGKPIPPMLKPFFGDVHTQDADIDEETGLLPWTPEDDEGFVIDDTFMTDEQRIQAFLEDGAATQ